MLLAGLATTATALVGVYLLDRNSEMNVMGWYANYVIPIGALLVGLVAGSGYGIASWAAGVKIRRGLLLAILGLQVLAYFSAQYIEFRGHGDLYDKSTGRVVTFPEYFHLVTMNFAWKGKDGVPGEPLGAAGYFFKLLEIAGFAAGGLIAPAVLLKHPYCELCQVYMKRQSLAVLPAAVPARKVKDPAARAAYDEEQRRTRRQADQHYADLKQAAGAGDVGTFRQWIVAAAGTKAAAKLPARLAVDLIHCRNCYSGYLRANLTTGQGKKIKVVELDKTDLSPDFVRGLRTATSN